MAAWPRKRTRFLYFIRGHGLQRDTEGLDCQPLARAHCHGGGLAVFPRELLKNVSRASSVGTEDVNRESAELETSFPRCVVIHPEILLYARPSVEKGGCLAALSEGTHMSGRPHGLEQWRASLRRLHKAQYACDVKHTRHPVCFRAFTCVR
jgi:hypothetical protein